MKKNVRMAILAAIAGAGILSSAGASAYDGYLTFEGATSCSAGLCADWQSIQQSYGDSAGVVDVSYIDVLHPDASLLWWSDAYNDLHDIAFANGGDGDGQSHARIEIKSLNGSAITLNSMDFGAWPNTTRPSHIRVTDIGGGSALFAYDGDIGVGTTTHNSFAPAVTSTNGIWIDWYSTAYNVGIDNVSFHIGDTTVTPVPEPETYAMLMAGLGLLGAVARRRKKNSV